MDLVTANVLINLFDVGVAELSEGAGDGSETRGVTGCTGS